MKWRAPEVASRASELRRKPRRQVCGDGGGRQWRQSLEADAVAGWALIRRPAPGAPLRDSSLAELVDPARAPSAQTGLN